MPSAPKKANVGAVLPIADLEVKNLELKRPEDEQDKSLRLHKEWLSFYVKDLGIWIFGIGFLVVASGYSFWALFSSSASVADKDWARSAVASIMAGIVGFLFGKTTK